MSVNSRQVGGGHYGPGRQMQHWDLCIRGGVRYLEGNATKYVYRWRKKSGAQDLGKAVHYIDKIIESNLAGIYPPPFRRPTPNTIRDFCLDHDVGQDEQIILRLVLQWTSLSDLELARQKIQTLIESVPGTPGDGGHHAMQEA